MRTKKLKISLTCKEIRQYAQNYNYPSKVTEDELSRQLKVAKKRGYMKRGDLRTVARWKWRGPHIVNLCNQNQIFEIKEVSALSFSTRSDLVRIESLQILKGVAWPMASVILHFAFENEYPILDQRAMRAVGGSTNYSFEKWMNYVSLCQKKAKRCGITMRELDKGLWVYGGQI